MLAFRARTPPWCAPGQTCTVSVLGHDSLSVARMPRLRNQPKTSKTLFCKTQKLFPCTDTTIAAERMYGPRLTALPWTIEEVNR